MRFNNDSLFETLILPLTFNDCVDFFISLSVETSSTVCFPPQNWQKEESSDISLPQCLQYIFQNVFAKLRIFNEISVTIWLQKDFKVIDTEDAAVANLAALAGGKQLDVAPTSVETVSQRDAVTEFEDRTVGFPYGNIHLVTAVKHSVIGRHFNVRPQFTNNCA